jgi:MFS family permease
MSPRGPFYFLKRLLPVGKDKDDVPPLGLRWRSNTFFIIATIAMGMFTDLFLYGLIVPVFPFMLEERIGTPPAQVQDLVDVMLSIYAAASCCASPLAGFLSDRIATTRQMPFLAGLSALLVATVMLALGRTVATLAIARFLQGASSGVVWTVGLAMCLETVGAKNLGKTIGTVCEKINFYLSFMLIPGRSSA